MRDTIEIRDEIRMWIKNLNPIYDKELIELLVETDDHLRFMRERLTAYATSAKHRKNLNG